MPTFDSAGKAALGGHFAPAFFIWLDIAGDPIRITTFGQDFTFTGSGDAELDGFEFNAFDGRAIDVGAVSNSENGSDTLTITLSGIVTLDAGLLADIANKSLWQGRTARLWLAVYDVDGVTQQGAVVPYYTGYMSSVDIIPSPKQQTIRLKIENYQAAFNQPSNRSYLNQKDYDAGDNSAAATIAAANAARHAGGATELLPFPTSGSGYSGNAAARRAAALNELDH